MKRTEGPPKSRSRFWTLRYTLIVALGVGLLVPAVFGSWYALNRQNETLFEDLREEHRRLVRLLSFGMASPLWELDAEKGQTLVASVMSDDRVTSICVRDAKLGVFIESNDPEQYQGNLFQLSESVVFEDRVIGSVEITVSDGLVQRKIQKARLEHLGIVTAQVLLSILMILALLQNRFLAPLEKLGMESRKLAMRELSDPFDWYRQDELGELGRSLEDTRLALKKAFEEIEAANKVLQADVRIRVDTEKSLRESEARSRVLAEDLKRANQQLLAAVDRLQELDRMKSGFLAIVSHELKTPIAIILGSLESLQAGVYGATDNRFGKVFEVMERSADRLRRLIDNLLDMSQIEAGRFQVKKASMDISACVRDAVVDLRPVAKQKDKALVAALPDVPVIVKGDTLRMTQVVANLVDNALRFAASEVRVALEVTSADEVIISVSDDGPGLPDLPEEKLFVPFNIVGKEHERGHVGLGLSIVRSIVEAHDGAIAAKNRDSDGGALIRVTIPLEKSS